MPATRPIQFRLDPETIAALERVADRYGVGTLAAAVRISARIADGSPPEAAPPPAPKSRKKSRATA